MPTRKLAFILASSDRVLAEKIAQRRSISPEQVNCRGCQIEKGVIKISGQSVCRTYDCATNKKAVGHKYTYSLYAGLGFPELQIGGFPRALVYLSV